MVRDGTCGHDRRLHHFLARWPRSTCPQAHTRRNLAGLQGPWTAYKAWKDEGGWKPGFASHGWSRDGFTGNAAFDAYRKEQLDRLEAERRKLDEDRKAFADYLSKLRRAKDQEEFNRFMAERTSQPPSNT
jgi:Protein of unknown function (DUF2852)